MANKTYNEEITRNVDWGGDASTNGLPVSGKYVQKFIKDEFAKKVGAVHKPEGANVVYCFANDDTKNEYLETGNEELILDSFQLASNYTVKFNNDATKRVYNISEGTTGVTVSTQFKIVDNSDGISDSKAKVTFTFLASGIQNKFTTEIQMNSEGWTTVNSGVIDKFLRNGKNTVTIFVEGNFTKASSQLPITVNMFDLTFDTDFAYTIPQTGNSITVPYSISCSMPKYVKFYLDGEDVGTDYIGDILRSDRKTISISSLNSGYHTLQVIGYVDDSDGKFYTPMHYYSFAKGGESPTSFLMHTVINDRVEVRKEGENFVIDAKQFEQVSFKWGIYDYQGRKLSVKFEYNGKVISEATVVDGTIENEFNFRPMDGGNGTLKIYALGEDDEKVFEETIDLDVEESDSGIAETTNGLLLKLTSTGRRNSDTEKDKWEFVNYKGDTITTEFVDFEWNEQQGWNGDTESLVISNGAYVTVNIAPMENDWATNGGTVEIDLETFDVEDDDAIIFQCKDMIEGKSTASLSITATKAELSTANNVSINTRYKDNDRIKVAFIGNPASTDKSNADANLIYIVVNGVLERAAMYDSTDNMLSDALLTIGNKEGKCKVRLRSLKVYDRAITIDEAFNNFVVESDNPQIIYERNDIFKEGSNEVGFDEIANKIPVMIFTGDMNDLVNSVKDKDWRPFDVEYINRQEPERNFVSFNARMKLQGTSSLNYPRKNFKLSTKDKLFNAEYYYSGGCPYVLDEDSVEGNLMLKDKKTGERVDFGALRNYCITLDYNGEPLKKGKYRFRADSHKTDKWTLKADFMESSGSHNVGAGRSWNKIFRDVELTTEEGGYNNNTYRDAALTKDYRGKDYLSYTFNTVEDGPVAYKVPKNTDAFNNQKKYVCRTDAQKICVAEGRGADYVRTAVDGFPMVCFYRTSHISNDLIFMGQYNFINDKSSFEVYGFEDIDYEDNEDLMMYDSNKVECWEGLKNTNPISLFKTTNNWDDANDGWASTFKARFPDPDDYGNSAKRQYDASKTSPLYEFCAWLTSTRHESDTVYGDTIDINTFKDETGNQYNSFAEYVNLYQYGYKSPEDAEAEGYGYAHGTGLVDNAENRQKKFETEKWEHFDVWKLAGYYIYLRRYGAVDQFVKNTMLFTDGNGRYDHRKDNKYRKWFYINYDNDCLFGVRNNGQLAFDWTLNRQTVDSASDIIEDGEDFESGANTYAMMGHDSTLWNNLEADQEFMRMVRDLDNSMSKVGLNYNNMVKEFDEEQTEKWCERVYNANERYKYLNAAKGIGDMSGNPVNNLWMLQGTRRSHRHWWIANHFNLLDAEWLSGDYKNTFVELKTNCMEGMATHAIAGADYYYAWGQNKGLYESNMVRNEGEAIDFVFPYGQSQGDPVRIYAFNKLSEMDFSDLAQYVFEGTFKFQIGTSEVSNTLKKLIIGNKNIVNNNEIDTTTWGTCLYNLEYLDVTNYKGIKTIPFAQIKNLKTFLAGGTSLASFTPAEGSRFDNVVLPDTVTTIAMHGITINGNFSKNFKYTPNTNLSRIELSNGKKIDMKYYTYIIKPWIEAIDKNSSAEAIYRRAYMDIKDIDWTFSSMDDVRLFKKFSRINKEYKEKNGSEIMKLSGRIDLKQLGNLSVEMIEEIKDIFGENCFNEKFSSLYIVTPESVFIQSDKEFIVAGQTHTFERDIYPDENAIDDFRVEYYIVEKTSLNKDDDRENIFTDVVNSQNYIKVSNLASLREGISFRTSRNSSGKEIGVLTTTENVVGGDTNILVLASLKLSTTDVDKVSVIPFKIKEPTYATSVSIEGDNSLYKNSEYKFNASALTSAKEKPLGTNTVEWSIEGEGASYISSSSVTENGDLVLALGTDQPEISSVLKISVKWTNNDSRHTVVTSERNVLVLNERVIMTIESNPVAMRICNENGWTSDPNAMTRDEAKAITNAQFEGAFSDIDSAFTFDEFFYFEGITMLPDYAFADSWITSIVLPDTIEYIGKYAFDGCKLLSNVYTKNPYDDKVKTLPNKITEISEGCFRGCRLLNELILPSNVTRIEKYAFGRTGFKKVLLYGSPSTEGTLILSDIVSYISGDAFETEKWTVDTTTNSLDVLSIPASIRTFDEYALFKGKNYSEFIVEEREDSPLFEVIDGVLYGRESLVRYPPMKKSAETYVCEDTSYINAHAFFAVKNVDTVITPVTLGMNGIFEYAFYDSSVKKIDMSESINLGSIYNNAFAKCKNLTDVIFPDSGSLTKLGHNIFRECNSLKTVELPDGLQEFESNASGYSYAFKNCESLEYVELPESVATIGAEFVADCNSLTYVKFPSEWTGVNEGAMVIVTQNGETKFVPQGNYITGCQNIERIILPIFSKEVKEEWYNRYDSNGKIVGTSYRTELEANKEKQPGEYVSPTNSRVINTDMYPSLVYCPNLKYYCLNENDDNKYMTANPENGCLYKINGPKTFYRAPFGQTTIVMDPDTEEMQSMCFVNCTNIEHITLSSSIKVIPASSFLNLNKIEEIELPESIEEIEESIGTGTFEGCSKLKRLTVPSKVKRIPYNFVRNCSSLTEIVFKGELLTNYSESNVMKGGIGLLAFIGCDKLSRIVFSNNVQAPSISYTYDNNYIEGIKGFHPFGYRETSIFAGQTNKSNGTNTIFAPYGFNGYSGEFWDKPTLDATYCGYHVENLSLGNGQSFNVKIYNGGTLHTGLVYAKSESGNFKYSGSIASGSYSESDNANSFTCNGNLYVGETVRLYSDSACTNQIGSIKIEYNKFEYQSGEPSMSKARMAAPMTFALSAEDEKDAHITQSEYDNLVAKVNQLTEILKNMK